MIVIIANGSADEHLRLFEQTVGFYDVHHDINTGTIHLMDGDTCGLFVPRGADRYENGRIAANNGHDVVIFGFIDSEAIQLDGAYVIDLDQTTLDDAQGQIEQAVRIA